MTSGFWGDEAAQPSEQCVAEGERLGAAVMQQRGEEILSGRAAEELEGRRGGDGLCDR
jgi:hypothetical protein